MSAAVEPFIARWQSAGGSERANYQLFLTELAAQFRHGDGADSAGYIDLYRRAA